MPFAIPKLVRRSKRLKGALEAPDLIVVGLGNPEPHYLNTRHNAGWWLVDALAEASSHRDSSRSLDRAAGGGQGAGDDGREGSRAIALAKPRTHVNGSGEAVSLSSRPIRRFARQAAVVYDEAALPPGKLRLRAKGGAAGHNGVNPAYPRSAGRTSQGCESAWAGLSPAATWWAGRWANRPKTTAI